MRLDLFLAELLYDHDCVIVPGFGGLVANYRPAKLNERRRGAFELDSRLEFAVGFNPRPTGFGLSARGQVTFKSVLAMPIPPV